MTLHHLRQTEITADIRVENYLYLSNIGETIKKTKTASASFQYHEIRNASSIPVYQWNGTFSLSKICEHANGVNFEIAYFSNHLGKIPIFVYDERQDRVVSKHLINNGSWKPTLTKAILDVVMQYPDTLFIDVGGGLGMFSLEVGIRGFQALLVDPSVSNIKRFCASAIQGGALGSVSVLMNPLSSRHEAVQMAAESNRVSEMFILDNNLLKVSQTNISQYVSGEVANAITLDDLLYLPEVNSTRHVVLHIDSAGYEEYILKGGEFFFRLLKIKVVFMDWTYNRHPNYSGRVIQLMMDKQFRPFDERLKMPLIETPYSEWPLTIGWVHESYHP
jgi:hypothetical protein